MRFQIGDKVWHATYEQRAEYITCPDCGGTGQITVIMHGGDQHAIECQNCALGYAPPTGRVKTYTCAPRAERVTVTGFECHDGKMTWSAGNFRLSDDRVFETEADALTAAQVLASMAEAREQRRIATKEKDTRTWAWNASYHRRRIKRAERELAYHTAKLNAANLKVKHK